MFKFVLEVVASIVSLSKKVNIRVSAPERFWQTKKFGIGQNSGSNASVKISARLSGLLLKQRNQVYVVSFANVSAKTAIKQMCVSKIEFDSPILLRLLCSVFSRFCQFARHQQY